MSIGICLDCLVADAVPERYDINNRGELRSKSCRSTLDVHKLWEDMTCGIFARMSV